MLVEGNSLELRQSVKEVFSFVFTMNIYVSVQIGLLEVIIVKV